LCAVRANRYGRSAVWICLDSTPIAALKPPLDGFDHLDAIGDVSRILISIDEFERLESLFPGDRRELMRLMGLFRATFSIVIRYACWCLESRRSRNWDRCGTIILSMSANCASGTWMKS
jgi:hypothetical protein